jgi:flagella basal body P-ring formation protein FlgA
LNLLTLFLLAVSNACVSVEGQHILAKDLARANPVFEKLAPDTVLGFTPNPGSTRVFHPQELRAIAARQNLPIAAYDAVCVTYAVGPPDASKLLEALRRSFGDPDQVIEIIDYSKVAIPEGAIEFPAVRVQSAVLRGVVRYAGSRTMPIWVRARIRTNVRVLVAAERLVAGRAIEPQQVKLELAAAGSTQGFLISPDQLAGRAVRRNVAAGTRLMETMLLSPVVVTAGQSVRVEVHSGAASISFTGKAETAGRAGATVLVLNEASKRRFQAKVTGPATVSAILQP